MTKRPPITLYTTPTCPDCRALKKWLAEEGIDYEEKNLLEAGMAEEAKARYGVRVAPLTVIGEEFFYGTFAEQRPKLAQALRLED